MTAPLLSPAESVEALTVLIERSGIDITADYADWCSIAFALAEAFGSAGEQFFHRISAFYPNYNPTEASKQFAACLRHKVPSGKAPVTIATLFHIAKSHGINLPPPQTVVGREPACPPVGREPMCSPFLTAGVVPPLRGGQGESFSSQPHNEEIEEIAGIPLPTFSQSIHDSLPSIMQHIAAASVSDVDADISARFPFFPLASLLCTAYMTAARYSPISSSLSPPAPRLAKVASPFAATSPRPSTKPCATNTVNK